MVESTSCAPNRGSIISSSTKISSIGSSIISGLGSSAIGSSTDSSIISGSGSSTILSSKISGESIISSLRGSLRTKNPVIFVPDKSVTPARIIKILTTINCSCLFMNELKY